VGPGRGRWLFFIFFPSILPLPLFFVVNAEGDFSFLFLAGSREGLDDTIALNFFLSFP